MVSGMIQAQTTTRGQILDKDVVDAFASRLQGSITLPSDSSYDQARAVWNGVIDRYPALVAHCETSADVVEAIAFAREHGLPIAVRGGGHSVAGHSTCDDGIVIDMSPMKEIVLDLEARTVKAGAGVTWGELDAASQEHGLATPGGVFSDTGIAGLTLGGGFGWLRNMYGLSCDNLISAEVVTADGQIIRASESENQDLLWGLRGGGGNFGIVTTFEYRLHPLGPEVFFTFCFFDGEGEKTQHLLEHFVAYMDRAPDEVSPIAVCGLVPPVDELFPADIHGRRYVAFVGLYAGPANVGESVMRPLREAGEVLIDFSGVMPYVEAQQAFDEDYPDGMRYYWKSTNISGVDALAIERIAEMARRQASPLSTVDLWPVGGAIRRVSPSESAFVGRQAQFLLNLEANWEDAADDQANITWVREGIAAMTDWSDGSAYINFGGYREDGVQATQPGHDEVSRRLMQVKAKYDPENIFRLNPNITPAE